MSLKETYIINVLGLDWKVRALTPENVPDKEWQECCSGFADYNKLTIYIDPHLPQQAQQQTIWYEILRAIQLSTGVKVSRVARNTISLALASMVKMNTGNSEDA